MSGLFPILRELRANGPATSPDIAETLGIKPKTASAYLYRLFEHGYIEPSGIRSAPGRPAVIWRVLEREKTATGSKTVRAMNGATVTTHRLRG